MLDRYNRLSYNYLSMLGYHTLIQNVILTKRINLMSATIVGIDIELKMKISRRKYLESRIL